MLLLLLSCQGYEKELEPVSVLVGSFKGQGRHPWGAYEEEITAEWAVGHTVLVMRSRSTMDGQGVFEDLRIISYDPARKKIRMRQYAMGDLAEYDLEVQDEGKTLLFRQTKNEGGVRPEWRYTFRMSDKDEFSYQVDALQKGAFAPYVKGSLKRR